MEEKKKSNSNKVFKAVSCSTLRSMLDFLNKEHITKEDIVEFNIIAHPEVKVTVVYYK